MFPTTVVILLFIGIAPCFMQTIPVDEDLQNELGAFQESLRTMDEDMEGQDIDQKEDFETRENTADIAQQDLDESLRTITRLKLCIQGNVYLKFSLIYAPKIIQKYTTI
jgi:hypothetical protein